ncbi:TetR/AcrR family transcriptional repressor of nem operon [Stenotrophomonas sp. 1278]|jgi:TetR/AcrR family transcriptional repressor of nem operon|uniref:TetR/AcrR family transcriptional regulator n=1 Tax=Stenotrophomonas sp. 1278 TaxID=2940566 RepID=UPI002474A485|nr:TetR/AcrR family transcriptional regulator [Stenotrophomonas sp. 1278]MDH6331680.1 TetR/AcrR family transcriptional repressor of nem operon [Stenotrophomonas sp. 1278]
MKESLSPKAHEILVHARSLLEAGGYNGFSYADVSARVNISKASIHHHFPSKADLVRTVVELYRAEAREGLALLDRQLGDPLLALNAYVDYWSSCIAGGTSSFCICAMLAAEAPMIPDEIADEVRGHFEDLSGWLTITLEKGAAQGQLRLQGTPADEAKAFMASVHGAMLAARGFGDTATFAALARLSIARLVPAV